jgi:tetratricopeptide (TPR) repeat protein
MKRSALGLLWGLLCLSLFSPLAAQSDPDRPSAHKLDLGRLSHVYQNWNNCGGATTTMALSYFGYPASARSDQERARLYLKPNTEDANVSPWQIADYINQQAGPSFNVRAVVRRGGDLEVLKRLLAADMPVIIEKGFQPPNEDWMGHYLLLIGYDDAAGIFYTYDSYMGHGNFQGLQETYDYISFMWRDFNNVFIPLYLPSQEAEVQAILGPLWDEEAAYERAKALAQNELAVNQHDPWAWFNLGESAVGLGDYALAVQAYRVAFASRALPWRLLWYMHGAFEAFYQTGDYETVLELAINLQKITPYIEEANYYRGLVYAAQGNTDQALFRLNLVLDFNANFYPAQAALDAINNGTFQAPVASATGG